MTMTSVVSKKMLGLAIGAVVLLAPTAAFAQRGHGGGGFGHGGGGGFRSGGRVVVGGGHGYRGGGGGVFYAPRPIRTRVYMGFGGGWVFPSYYGPSYAYYGPAYGSDPYYYPPQAAAPSVTVQPQDSYPAPAPQQSPQQQPQDQPVAAADNYYLIAFTDHTVQSAVAYKVEGEEFYWITRDNQERHAPLATLDVALSQRINAERKIDFQLP